MPKKIKKKSTPANPAARQPHGAISKMSPAQLKAARLELGLTQAALGALLGITKTEVYRKESGSRPITTVQALAVQGLLAMRAGDPEIEPHYSLYPGPGHDPSP